VGNSSGHPVTQPFPVWPTMRSLCVGETVMLNLRPNIPLRRIDVNLKNIVPALALAAFVAAPAMAADAMPAVSFEGWVDTILSYESDDSNDVNTTAKDDSAGDLRFSAEASLKANWKVTDALSARVNLWFAPSDEDSDNNSNLTMREAYFAWAINENLTWSMGKYINTVGWIAAEPTGLYTVNNSNIGYLDIYGNDVIGTSLAFAPKGAPISGSVHLTNGYYTAVDATNDGPSASRENTDLGLGLDVTFVLPNELGNVNFDFAYDMHSDAGGAANNNELGGDVLMVGLNATLKVIKPLMLGAEIMYLTLDDGEDDAGADVVNGQDRLQFLALANFAIEGASIPMSVTGSIQYVTIDFNDTVNAPETEDRLGVSVALLTNPLTSSNFGLNFEVGFWDVSNEDGSNLAADDDDGIVLAVEGLVSF
jgi:hypothetical protein